MLHWAICIISKPSVNSDQSYSPEMLNSGQPQRFIVKCDLEIWRMILKNYRAPLLRCFKLYASFDSHRWTQTKVTVREPSIWVKIGDFLSRVTLKFDGWPWKTIGHLRYASSSFVHHFIAIGEFKLELQPGNTQFGSKSTFFSCVTLEIDGWTWKTTGEPLPKQQQALCIISSSYVNSNWSYSPETAKLGYDLCDLDLWSKTLTFCMDITSVIDNDSWKFRDDTMTET